ncbi:MAG: hypothetical protein JXL80_12925 [Planctomycetes bacterium]|nr:hypothetical protein [Planctomycetota bacterium]
MEPQEPTEVFEKLSRLASGELPDEQALELTDHMVRDDGLRRELAELRAVDELLKEACLGDETSGASGMPSAEQRERQIGEILARTEGSAARASMRLGRPALGWKRVGRALPWVVAACLAVVCGVLVHWHLGRTGLQGPMTSGLNRRLIAQYVGVRDKLGDASMAVIWSNNEVREEGFLGAAVKSDLSDVIVRVTVVRTDGDRSEQWSADALMRRGHAVELVTEAERQWPASVRICARPGGNGLVPLTAEIRLTDDPPTEINNRQIMMKPSAPASIGSVVAGPWRYEVFIEAAVVSGMQPSI